MARRTIALLVMSGLTSLALAVAVSLPTELAAANKVSQPSKKPIRNPKFDPTADQVDLFDAVGTGQVSVRLIPKDAIAGTVLIENKTDKPLTVKIPETVVGISIHAQIGLGQGFLGQGNNGLGLGNNANGGNAQQANGGGVNQGQNGQNGQQLFGQPNGQQNPLGNGFFSIPAEKVISLDFNSVCLEHGKPEPNSSSKYTLIPVSKVSQDPVLYQLLATVATGKVDAQAAQAAAWHLTDKMSFQDLADKVNTPLGGQASTPYFTREQLDAAKELLTQATERAAAVKSAEKTEPKAETPVKTTSSARAANN